MPPYCPTNARSSVMVGPSTRGRLLLSLIWEVARPRLGPAWRAALSNGWRTQDTASWPLDL